MSAVSTGSKSLVSLCGALVLTFSLVGVSLSVNATGAGASTPGDQIVAFAASQSGVPYCDGGGGISGPSYGGVDEPGCGPANKGFDCMSLVQYAVFQATGIVLPSDGSQKPGVGTFIAPEATFAEDMADLLPGDGVFWGGGGINSFAHSGIYAGNGEVWDAVGINIPVQEHSMSYLGNLYRYDGAMRYPATGGLVAPVVGMASTPDGGGYWLVASDGGIFSFGDAPFFGSMGGRHLNAPVVDIAPTPDGGGYWLVASDGGIFSFGDARFQGSMGGEHLNDPIVGISADDATGGYWLVATDGGIFSFGAPFLGSTGNRRLTRPVNGMTSLTSGQGYWFVASDGGIFAEGSAPFLGSMGAAKLNAPVVGLATDAATGGYWLVASDGGIFSFGAPFYGAG